MKNGNWVPLDKNLILLKERGEKYTEIEAAFSLQLDLDSTGKILSRNDYSRMWKWSRTKVDGFLNDIGIINRPQNILKPSSNRPPIRICYKDLGKSTVRKPSSNRPKNVLNYHNILKDIYKPLGIDYEFENILRLKQPTPEQLAKLIKGFGLENVKGILFSMENYEDLLKKYKSVYLTAQNWLKRDNGNGKPDKEPDERANDYDGFLPNAS